MNTSFTSLTAAQLQRATAIKIKIEKLEKDLAGILGTPAATGAKTGRKGWKMSAAAKAKISAAAKARWAKIKSLKKK
jgi:hypothetical protein